MLMPSIFGENLFDNFFDDFTFPDIDRNIDRKLYGKHAKNMMKTDVKEKEKNYEVAMDLPGFKKDEIQIQLHQGYLTIQAAKGLDKDEEEKDGKYVRRERYAGSMSRSFYVGEDIKQEDIKASFNDGVLKLDVPKKTAIEKKNQPNLITID